MCHVVEINLIAHVETKSDWPQKRFRSATRIKYSAHVLASNASHIAEEFAHRGRSRIKMETNRSALGRQEQSHRPFVCLEFRTKQAVYRAHVSALNERTCGISFRENLVEVVRRFGFELKQRQNIERYSRTNAHQVCIRLINSEKFSENSNLDVVESAGCFVLRECLRRPNRKHEQTKNGHDCTLHVNHCVFHMIVLQI